MTTASIRDAVGDLSCAGGQGDTVAQAAYARIKELIVALEFPPGATIRESDLQQRLGIGRTPLREALQRLANDGMLHIYPRRAIVVAKLGVQEVRQVFEMRVALEATAAALAAQRLTEEERREIRALGDDLRRSRDASDATHFLHADQAFHRSVARYARNAYLDEAIDRMLTLNLWLWHMYFAARGVHGNDLFAHEPIIEALLAGDAVAAEAAMREHVLCSKEQLLAGL